MEYQNSGIEVIEPLFLDPAYQLATGITPKKVYRVQIGAGRHYRSEDGQTFKSITTFLDAVMKEDRFIKGWREALIEDLGSRQAVDHYVESTADFGTGLHIAVAEYCRNGFVDWLDFERFSFDYLIGMGLKDHTLFASHEELTKDLASMLAFFYDYEVKVIAVEIPVFSSDGYATLIDLIVEMNDKCYTDATPKGKRKRVVAGINLKSGKKGFFDAHIFQLIGERRAFNETYGRTVGFELFEVYNLAPTKWRTEPGYKIARQTKTIIDRDLESEFELYVQLGKKKGVLGRPSKSFVIFEGRTEYGGNPVDNLRVLDYEQFAKRRLTGASVSPDQVENLG